MSGDIMTMAVSGVAGQLLEALDGLFTSDDERNQAKLKMQELLMQPQMSQAIANINAAQHPSLFVAGARPSILWICAIGLGWELLGRQLLGALLVIFSVWAPDPTKLIEASSLLPSLDIEAIMGLIFALLGLGTWRTVEKVKGVARERL